MLAPGVAGDEDVIVSRRGKVGAEGEVNVRVQVGAQVGQGSGVRWAEKVNGQFHYQEYLVYYSRGDATGSIHPPFVKSITVAFDGDGRAQND
jgi:hypothetical protein